VVIEIVRIWNLKRFFGMVATEEAVAAALREGERIDEAKVKHGYEKYYHPKRSLLISLVICLCCIYCAKGLCNTLDQVDGVAQHMAGTMIAIGEVFGDMADKLDVVAKPLGAAAAASNAMSRRLDMDETGAALAGTAKDMLASYANPVMEAAEKIGSITLEMLTKLSLVMQSKLGISFAGLAPKMKELAEQAKAKMNEAKAKVEETADKAFEKGKELAGKGKNLAMSSKEKAEVFAEDSKAYGETLKETVGIYAEQAQDFVGNADLPGEVSNLSSNQMDLFNNLGNDRRNLMGTCFATCSGNAGGKSRRLEDISAMLSSEQDLSAHDYNDAVSYLGDLALENTDAAALAEATPTAPTDQLADFIHKKEEQTLDARSGSENLPGTTGNMHLDAANFMAARTGDLEVSKEALQEQINNLESTAQGASDQMQNGYDELVATGQDLQGVAQDQLDDVKALTEETIAEAQDELDSIQAQAAAAAGNGIAIAANRLDVAKAKLSEAKSEVTDELEAAKDLASDKLEDVKDDLQNAREEAHDLYDDTKAKAVDAVEGAKETYDEAMDQAEGKLGEIKAAASEKFEEGKEKAQELYANGKEKATEMINNLKGSITGNVKNEIVKVMQMLVNGLQQLSMIVNKVKGFLGSKSEEFTEKQNKFLADNKSGKAGGTLLDDLAARMNNLIDGLQGVSPELQEDMHGGVVERRLSGKVQADRLHRHRQLQARLADSPDMSAVASHEIKRQLLAEVANEGMSTATAVISAADTARFLEKAFLEIGRNCAPVVDQFAHYGKIGAIAMGCLGCFISLAILLYTVEMHHFKSVVDKDGDGEVDLSNDLHWRFINMSHFAYYFLFFLCDVYMLIMFAMTLVAWLIFALSFMLTMICNSLDKMPSEIYAQIFEEGEKELLCDQIDAVSAAATPFAIVTTVTFFVSLHLLPFLQDAYAKYNINESNAEFWMGMKLFLKSASCGYFCASTKTMTVQEMADLRDRQANKPSFTSRIAISMPSFKRKGAPIDSEQIAAAGWTASSPDAETIRLKPEASLL
jgi:hypothetical protein